MEAYDGVAHFPETQTAVTLRLHNKEIEILAPYGLKDLFEMKVKPTTLYQNDSYFNSLYIERVTSKQWKKIWDKLSLEI
ncbi:nucleotidyltransferase family protein [Carnobacterium alterfunditum]|uniref:nucleotidyltransferase family protein n=1 Tax=Carnobacterium alterfunditum TaxID=28230 RepID=UPI0009DEFFED|nr:nucleotidyltransferase family protein [Carnobacterium alterfunditum]